ncbi:hypothetical protein BC834DRAFT_881283 [Gloeopeniophorella convolvens]|nr:hypothetical protein BC834DRAFT_881283 [Gloeopeniophorella convolvens]
MNFSTSRSEQRMIMARFYHTGRLATAPALPRGTDNAPASPCRSLDVAPKRPGQASPRQPGRDPYTTASATQRARAHRLPVALGETPAPLS